MRMIRSTMLALLPLAAALAAVPPASAPGQTHAPRRGHARAAEKPPLSVRLAACHTGTGALARYAVFQASMPSTARADRMWLRFDLQQRLRPDAPWTGVAVPKLGIWNRSLPGRPGFVYIKRVDQLAAPADYRAVVRFRWYDAAGRLVRTARLVTAACRQPDPRPELDVGGLQATPGPRAGEAMYALTLRNGGRGAAGAFAAVLAVDGRPQPALAVPSLAPGEIRTVQLTAPACAPGSFVQVTVDADGAVDEADETNDDVVRPCPLAGR
jgi:CARDB